MLILARKVGETLVIGDNIKVVVMDVKGSQIKLGIDAPEDVVVNREEVHKKGYCQLNFFRQIYSSVRFGSLSNFQILDAGNLCP